MKIKGKFLALIITAILIASSVSAFLIYQSVQDERVSYIGVRTNKDVFVAGENVTFDLVSLTDGAVFNISDPGNANEYMVNYGGVNIYRVPDLIDVDDLLDDPVHINYLRDMISMRDVHLAKIHYNYFDSNEGPLEMAWNGTIEVYDLIAHEFVYYPATTGNYMIIPDLQYGAFNHMVFLLDESAIFHYESLTAGLKITNVPDTNVTVELALKAPPGTAGDLNCDLFTTFEYNDYMGGGLNEPLHYYNRTGLVLASDHDERISFSFDIAIPDHGTPYDDGGYYLTAVNFHALLVTASGNYTFGFTAIWDGGWLDISQY